MSGEGEMGSFTCGVCRRAVHEPRWNCACWDPALHFFTHPEFPVLFTIFGLPVVKEAA